MDWGAVLLAMVELKKEASPSTAGGMRWCDGLENKGKRGGEGSKQGMIEDDLNRADI